MPIQYYNSHAQIWSLRSIAKGYAKYACTDIIHCDNKGVILWQNYSVHQAMSKNMNGLLNQVVYLDNH